MTISRSDGLLPALRGLLVAGRIWCVSAAGVPSPSHRPRVTRAGITFYPKTYVAWQRACQDGFARARKLTDWPTFGQRDRLLAFLDVRVARPKRTILATPRGDVDNYAKGPLDAATKLDLWPDDSNVVLLLAQKRWVPVEHQGVTLGVGLLTDHGEERVAEVIEGLREHESTEEA